MLLDSNLLPSEPLSDSSAIAKWLLSAWSAEYALRLTPIAREDEAFVKASNEWLIPQAYYSCAFSLRAVLQTKPGCEHFSKTLALLAAAQSLHKMGLYQFTDLPAYYLYELNAYRMGTALLDAEAALALQGELLLTVRQVALAHEQYLAQVIGIDAYAELIKAAPAYLRTSFLSDRLGQIWMRYQHETKEEVVAA